MLTRLRIEQFKAFGAAQDIPLAPITLIYGPNSAGKSAVIEALLLLNQTMADNNPTHALTPNGPWLNLRHYQTLIHSHDTEADLRLGAFWRTTAADLVGLSQIGGQPVEVGMEWTWGWNKVGHHTVQRQTQIYLADSEQPVFQLNVNPDDFDRFATDPPPSHSPSGITTDARPKHVDLRKKEDQSDRDSFSDLIGTVSTRSMREDQIKKYEEARAAAWEQSRHRSRWDPRVPMRWIEKNVQQPSVEWRHLTAELTDHAVARWALVVEHLRWWKELVQSNPRLAEKHITRIPWSEIEEAPWMMNDDEWTDEGRAQMVEHLQQAPWDAWIRWMTAESAMMQARQWAMTFEQTVQDDQMGEDSAMEAEFLRPLRWAILSRPTMGQHPWSMSIPHYAEYHHWSDYLIPHLLQAWYRRLSADDQAVLPPPERFGDLPDLWLPPTTVVSNLNWEVGNALTHVAFIGPARTRFGPIVERDDQPRNQVGMDGQWTVDRIAQHPELVEAVNAALAAMDMGYRVSVAPVDDPDLPRLWKLQLWDDTLGVSVSMDQVGYGVSQIVPLVVEVIAGEFPLTLLEQPELHLHPRLQAAFGSVLEEAVTANPARQFIIETHSETLLQRLRKLIRTGHLLPEMVSIVYIEKTPDGSQALPIRLDSQGNFLDPWPHGFFEEGFDELFGGTW